MPTRHFDTPRSCAKEPTTFGTKRFEGWNAPDTIEKLVSLRAAEVQHEFCVLVRIHIDASPKRYEAIGAEIGFSTKRLGRLLNGHFHLTLNDALRIETHLPGNVLLGLKVNWQPVFDDALAKALPGAKMVYPESHKPRQQVQPGPVLTPGQAWRNRG